MPKDLREIQKPIENEIQEFELKFKDYMNSNVLLLDKIMTYIVKRKGKQLRPMFIFLVAKMCGGITERTFRGAALIELLHTATLVHDDVVDDSNYRRGFFSINALWKNKIAVLVGDFLLSKGLLLSIDNGDFDLLKIVSTAVREMSEGELLQIEKSRLLDITEAVYYEIIRQKTASLFASCCGVGASSSSASEDEIVLLKKFGETIGIAFQIKDDLFDYGKNDIGKPLGIDIKEKKMTLPLIYALEKSTWAERQKIIFLIKNFSHKTSKVNEIIEFVKQKGGIEYASEEMNKFHQKALTLLDQFPDSDSKRSLINLVDFTISRNK